MQLPPRARLHAADEQSEASTGTAHRIRPPVIWLYQDVWVCLSSAHIECGRAPVGSSLVTKGSPSQIAKNPY